MTPKQIALVQLSWRRVQPISEQAAAMFYGRLFLLEPSVVTLFQGDMKEQGRRLMSMISVAVNSLARIKTLVPALQALGRRHAGYGVQERHYAIVEEALVWTLQQGLGEKFTPDTEQAWRTAYSLLATTMKDATRKEEARAA